MLLIIKCHCPMLAIFIIAFSYDFFISFVLKQNKRNKEKFKEKQCFNAQSLRTPAVFPAHAQYV